MTHDEQYDQLISLQAEFIDYCNEAKQNEFEKLIFVDLGLEITLRHFIEDTDFVMNEKEWNAMHRTVYQVIHSDKYWDYVEEDIASA